MHRHIQAHDSVEEITNIFTKGLIFNPKPNFLILVTWVIKFEPAQSGVKECQRCEFIEDLQILQQRCIERLVQEQVQQGDDCHDKQTEELKVWIIVPIDRDRQEN